MGAAMKPEDRVASVPAASDLEGVARDATTLLDVIGEFEQEGFDAQFLVRDGARLECAVCRAGSQRVRQTQSPCGASRARPTPTTCSRSPHSCARLPGERDRRAGVRPGVVGRGRRGPGGHGSTPRAGDRGRLTGGSAGVMGLLDPALHRIDRFQQRRRWAAFPVGVVKKYGDDHGSMLAALVSYYAFLALVPAPPGVRHGARVRARRRRLPPARPDRLRARPTSP